jgi:3-ketosteroid 9alpha-monooxygenase subunit A
VKITHPVQVGTRLFPAGIVPSGWYQIGWSQDFEAGRPVPLHYFDQSLVAFRGESGGLHVLDAYCRHMGAHLGHGGKVMGDEIECPYHGWRWSGRDGANTCIPYGTRDRMHVSLGCWQTKEIDGIVLAWYSGDHRVPRFEPPDRFYRGEGEPWEPFPKATTVWRELAMVPQFAAENVADPAHFKYVHRALQVPALTSFEADNGVFRTHWDLTFGEDRSPTWATPTGPVQGHIVTETHGLGLGWNTQYAFDEVTSLAGYTPIDAFSIDARLTVWAPRQRSDGSPLDESLRDRWFKFQKGQIESDIQVWANQTYVERAPFASTESKAMRALRQWSEQFYERTESSDVTATTRDNARTLDPAPRSGSLRQSRARPARVAPRKSLSEIGSRSWTMPGTK